MSVTAAINQLVQVGQESSLGGGGDADHILESISFMPTEKTNTTTFKPIGHRHATLNAPEKQWTSWTIDQPIATFTEVLYLYEALWGTVTPTDLGNSTKKRVYTPPLTGSITPASLVVQQGDDNNVNEWTMLVLDSFTKKWSRDGISCSATAFSQSGTDGETFTSTPSSMAQATELGKYLSFYLDATSDDLGETQVEDTILNAEFSVKGLFEPFFDCNRDEPSAGDIVDADPTTELTLTCVENSTTRSMLQHGVTQFLRIEVIGPETETGQDYVDTWDLAIQLKGDVPYEKDGAIWARKLTFSVVEDADWTKAYEITNQTAEGTL